uniref:Uncharacterized protein TCIL3000_4_1990 n=1 Tax=Trypanosoma congolense (strain IL3000) TaxID=1068625 RepID=G0UL56_TRYCI|nr:unnamed protein product [Trypanosoma congolense IL3000]
METVFKEDVPPVRLPSTSSTPKSFRNSPKKTPLLGEANGDIVTPRQLFSAASEVRQPSSKWCRKFLSTYFLCELCQNVVTDPVQILPNILLVCRRCALSRRVPTTDLLELPLSLTKAYEDLYEGQREVQLPMATRRGETGRMSLTSDDAISKRRMVRVKRPEVSADNDAQKQQLPSASLNSPMSARAGGSSQLQQALRELEHTEYYMRVAIDAEEATNALDMKKSCAAGLRRIQSRGRENSRTLKTEADSKYEQGEYTLALELYTKAIEKQPHDRLTRPTALYGNRSSAFFMARRFSECIADCMEVIRLEPGNLKIYTRAAKAAASMGDLAGAVSHMEMIPEQHVTSSSASEKEKYISGLDLLRSAEANFGRPESNDVWQMLIAQFSESFNFRLRYAESLILQRRHMKAVETLEVVPPSFRTPKLLYTMANSLYMSGFEYFDKARVHLEDAEQLDEGCAQLLRVLNMVDEGKQKGNQYFQQKNFVAAMEHYTAAINSSEGNGQVLRILYCNRAAAYKELGKYREAIDDCTKAIQLDPTFSKAYARRARCHQFLSDFASAMRDFRLAIKYDPCDQELPRELRSCEHSLAKEGEREKDFYYVLGVSRTATEREIKAKYRELSLRWHPDKCMSLSEEERVYAEHKFKVIVEAHTTLVDPVKRRDYDLKMERNRLSRPGGGSAFNSYSADTFRGQANRFRQGGGGFW